MANKPSLAWPVVGRYPISFRFGEAPGWYTKIFGGPHNGIDISCPEGTPVLGCDKGEVSFSDDIPDSNGKGLILKHTWGVSLYWHLSQNIAKLGNLVEKGSMIGHSGQTGYCTGPHLHFAIKVYGQEIPGMKGWTDPVLYLSEPVPVPTPPPTLTKYHLVKPGDSLWSIAQKYYGNGFEWRRIFEANKEKIKNPNLIWPLQRLLIP
jgi:murein DD-endopeptidase MepM/ murein hydrolase activator NlpD